MAQEINLLGAKEGMISKARGYISRSSRVVKGFRANSFHAHEAAGEARPNRFFFHF